MRPSMSTFNRKCPDCLAQHSETGVRRISLYTDATAEEVEEALSLGELRIMKKASKRAGEPVVLHATMDSWLASRFLQQRARALADQ